MISIFRIALFSLLACIPSLALADSQQDLNRYIYNSLLLSDQPEEIRMAARAAGRASLDDVAILDTMAANLWRYRYLHKDKLVVDTLSWLAKDLGLSGNPRYRTLLLQCRNEFSGNEKLLNYIDEALEKLPAHDIPGEQSFDIEKFDFVKVAESLKTLQAQYPATGTPVTDIPATTSLREALSKLGLPAAIDASIRRESAMHFASWDASYLRIWYPNSGGIRFTYEKEDGAGWQALDHWPILTSHPIRYTGKDWGLAYALWTTDRVLLRETAQRLYRSRVSNTEVLDVIADRLWLSMEMPDPAFSDAYAWLIKVLELSQKFRYKLLLRELIAKSPDKKVVRYAEDAVNKVNAGANDPVHERYSREPIQQAQ